MAIRLRTVGCEPDEYVKEMKKAPELMREQEFQRKMALECSRRCLAFQSGKADLNAAEKLCVNRCIGKMMNVREVVDGKLKNEIDPKPIIFN